MQKITKLPNKPAPNKNNGNKSAFKKNNNNNKIKIYDISNNDIE